MFTILYPFRANTDFQHGYAWAAELTRRLKGRLLLFTTMDTATAAGAEPLAEVYRALADAQGAYIRNFQILSLKLRPVRSERNFLEGDFVTTLSEFLGKRAPDILVLQAGLLPPRELAELVRRHKTIMLSPHVIPPSAGASRKDSARLFLDIYHEATLYNLPPSFFKTISRDITLFNSLASFFRK